MTTDEFAHFKNVRRATDEHSCTGGEPCIHSACHTNGGWYCLHPDAMTKPYAFVLPHPDDTVCDSYSQYVPDGTPSVPFAALSKKIQANP